MDKYRTHEDEEAHEKQLPLSDSTKPETHK